MENGIVIVKERIERYQLLLGLNTDAATQQVLRDLLREAEAQLLAQLKALVVER